MRGRRLSLGLLIAKLLGVIWGSLGRGGIEADPHARLILREISLINHAIGLILSIEGLPPDYATHDGALSLVILILLHSLWGVQSLVQLAVNNGTVALHPRAIDHLHLLGIWDVRNWSSCPSSLVAWAARMQVGAREGKDGRCSIFLPLWHLLLVMIWPIVASTLIEWRIPTVVNRLLHFRINI